MNGVRAVIPEVFLGLGSWQFIDFGEYVDAKLYI